MAPASCARKQELRSILATLALALCVLAAMALLRGQEYDEGYTIFLAAGHRLPAWPASFNAGDARAWYAGHSTAAGIAAALRADDVHPPLYFWAAAAWRGVVGTSWGATRALSVLCGLATLALLARLAGLLAVPAGLAIRLTLLAYGFAYTAAIARGFALAQLLCVAGLCLAVAARRGGSRAMPLSAACGAAFGAAALTNYLTCFVGCAAMLWLLRVPRLALAAAAGGLPFLPALAWCVWPQLLARPGQFAPFRFLPALVRLVGLQAAAWFGGLPLYAGAAAVPVAAALGLLGLLLLRAVLRTPPPPAATLLAMAAAAPAAGLLLLGALSGQAPIELRYLVFGIPPAALLLAAALRTRPVLGAATGAVQALGIAGLMLRPETMQPQAEAARRAAALPPDTVLLLPRGNDGVGVVGAFVAAAPDRLRLRLVTAADTAAGLRALGASGTTLAAVLLPLDRDSRAQVDLIRAAFAGPCWQAAPADPSYPALVRLAPRCPPAAAPPVAQAR